jgi:hypothetical protein
VNARYQIILKDLHQFLAHPSKQPHQFAELFLRFFTLMLGGINRIQLIDERGAGDLLEPPTCSLQALFESDSSRAEVSRIVHRLFGLYYAIDPLKSGYLRPRLYHRPPQTPPESKASTHVPARSMRQLCS